jgi:D-alanyl-D-alanine carboxypeptidase
MFEESASLLNACFENYENKKIIDKDKEIFNEYILSGKEGKLYLYAEEDFYYPIRKDEIKDLKLEYNVTLNSANEGEEVGEIKVFFKKHLIKTIKLFTMNKIDKLVNENTLSIEQILWEEKLNEN